MIIKAKVITNSSEDPEGKGKVKIECQGLWENSKDSGDYYPVVNSIPLNLGDVVFVYLQDILDVANPLILGKCRDNSFQSNGSNPENFSVLWESVVGEEDSKEWAVLYTKGSQTIYENSEGVVMSIKGRALDILLPIDDSNSTKFYIDPGIITYTTPDVSLSVDRSGNVSYTNQKSTLSLDEGGNVKIVTEGTITNQGEGETSDQPVPLGDTLLEQLKLISARVDAVVDAVTNMLSSGIPAPMDGGASLKTTMQTAWSSSSTTLKSNIPNVTETWQGILNTSVTTAGKAK